MLVYLGEVLIISVVIPIAHGHSCLGHSSKNVRNESCSRNSVDQTEWLFLSLRMEKERKNKKEKENAFLGKCPDSLVNKV